MKKILVTVCLLFASYSFAQSISSELESINDVLDSYHVAASEGDWDRYFDLMSDDGVFLGTDAAERWPKEL